MNRHPGEEILNDYIDGLLPEAERQNVEQHLGDCTECTRIVEELRSLLAGAGALPDIPPANDLLPGIRDGVRTAGPRWGRWIAAVAAVLVVALLGSRWLERDAASTTPAGGEQVSIEVLLEEFRAAEEQYLQATNRLMQVLEQRRDEIPPEMLAVLDENVRLIDSAIAEVRLAMDLHGPDRGGGHTLTALYNKKLQLLWQASRLWS